MNPIGLMHEIIEKKIPTEDEVKKSLQDEESAIMRDSRAYHIWLNDPMGQNLMKRLENHLREVENELIFSTIEGESSDIKSRALLMKFSITKRLIDSIKFNSNF